MSKRTDWSEFRHRLTDERERMQAKLPDDWRCDLSIASYSHGSVPSYHVSIEHDGYAVRVYGTGTDPASAFAQAVEKMRADMERRSKSPRLAAAEVKPAALPAEK